MDPARIRQLVKQLDTAKARDEEEAWVQLKPLGKDVVPYLAEFYAQARKWQGRVSLLFHSIRHARTSEAAFQLGVDGLRDKATMVRYRACGLLAYSLREDAIPHLEELLCHPDSKTVADAKAAIDAIRQKNHHYFIDRTHSGRSFWDVNPGDVAG
jgi:hypothetical protein